MADHDELTAEQKGLVQALKDAVAPLVQVGICSGSLASSLLHHIRGSPQEHACLRVFCANQHTYVRYLRAR